MVKVRQGFTLIELIFVIVIIGVLGAVAVPKFLNLKQHAEANNIIKTVNDAMSAVPSSFVNMVDLEDKNASDIKLDSLLEIKGQGWTYDDTGNGKYTFKPTSASGEVATLELKGTERAFVYMLDCSKFNDETTRKKCWKTLNGSETTTAALDGNVSFQVSR